MYKIIGADRKEYGPVSAEQLRQWVAEGRVNAQTLVQAEGQTSWQPLSAFSELSGMPGVAPAPSISPQSVTIGPVPDVTARLKGPGISLLILGAFIVLAALGNLVVSLTGTAMHRTGNPQ